MIGSKSKEISLSLYVSPHTYGNFKMNFVARLWMRSVLVIRSIDCGARLEWRNLTLSEQLTGTVCGVS